MKFTQVRPDRSIDFYFRRVSGKPVRVAGSFSDWEQIEMSQVEQGLWNYRTEPLASGTYQYKFVYNNSWIADPNNVLTAKENGNSMITIGRERGSLHRCEFFSQALGYNKAYTLYLPSSYVHEPDHQYPVLYLMGGLFDYELSWIREGGISKTLDAMLVEGQIGDLIVVMPDKDNNCFVEGDWTQYGAYLVRDLLHHCETEYRCSVEQSFRAIEGLSLGAGWALRLTAQYPEMYGSVSSLSGYIPDDVLQLIEQNQDKLQEKGVRFRLFCGDEEKDLIPHLVWAQQWMTHMGIPCEFFQGDGIHRWALWSENIKHSLIFHDYGFKRSVKKA